MLVRAPVDESNCSLGRGFSFGCAVVKKEKNKRNEKCQKYPKGEKAFSLATSTLSHTQPPHIPLLSFPFAIRFPLLSPAGLSTAGSLGSVLYSFSTSLVLFVLPPSWSKVVVLIGFPCNSSLAACSGDI